MLTDANVMSLLDVLVFDGKNAAGMSSGDASPLCMCLTVFVHKNLLLFDFLCEMVPWTKSFARVHMYV